MNSNNSNLPEYISFPPKDQEKMVLSADLFGGGTSLVINHHGLYYTLRITQLGKLILTK
jgi:hemin uptake protein HemP